VKEVFDFLAGELPIDEFIKQWKADQRIVDWLQQIIDDTNDSYDNMNDQPYCLYRNAIVNFHKGSVSSFTKNIYNTQYGLDRIAEHSAIFNTVYSIVKVVFPDIPITTIYTEQFDLCLYALGESIGGPEVENCIGDVMEEVFALPARGRKKMAREKIRAMFPCEKRYPFWAQEPEWPMGEQRPMKFLYRKRDEDKVDFIFKDVDTGKLRVVTQYY